MDRIFKEIEERYIKTLGVDTNDIQQHYYQSRVDKESNIIVFYHVIWTDYLKSFRNQVKDTNKVILKYIQSNYFYKVTQVREETHDKFEEHGMKIYMNKIQITEVDKSPKTAHLATLKTIKDFYV